MCITMSLRCSVMIQSRTHQSYYWVSTDSSQGCWGYLQVYQEDGDGSLLYPTGVPQSKGHLLTYNTCILQKGDNRTRHARVQAPLLTPLTLWPRSRHGCLVTLSNLLLHVQMYTRLSPPCRARGLHLCGELVGVVTARILGDVCEANFPR